MSVLIICNQCFSILIDETGGEKERQPCPYCNSVDREIHVFLNDKFEICDLLTAKLKKNDKGEPILEIKSGEEIFELEGIRVGKIRIIDKENDKYFELIHDKNGNVIRRCEEKLSNHQGHGLPNRSG
jgi:hypothetical protein